MKRILFILLLTILFIGCGQTDYNKGYYENGQLRWEGNIKDGKIEGLWKWYYENGQLQCEGNYKDGKGEGLWKEYDYSGIYQETQYWNNGWRGYK
tara:strand:+ start:359 stop:643 length:285 start_codon:yes stop_codon:yes gene_type:complete